MRSLTFKQFLSIVEDVEQDISSLTMQKQQMLVRKAAQDRQIDNQIANIDRQLFQKEKQRESEQSKTNNTSPTDPTQAQNPAARSNQTTTPGGTSAQTPGQSSLSAVPER